MPNDPVLVVINEDESLGALDEWLAALDRDEPSDVDAGAADTLREIREHGER